MLPEELAILLAAVRGSRLTMLTVATAGITTGAYPLFDGVTEDESGVGEAGDSMTGEAGDSKVGDAGESIVGEAGDSTIVNLGESERWEKDSIEEDAGKSLSAKSGGARKGESSADFFQSGSFLSFVTDNLGFFFTGSSTSVPCF